MSWPGSRTNVSRLLPFTPRGGFFFFLSAGFLLAGLLRRDLAALLWGSAFQLLAFYCLAGSHLVRARVGRHLARRGSALDVRFPSRELFAGEEGAAELRSDLPRPLVPGFQLRYRQVFAGPDRPPIRLSCELPAGRFTRRLRFPAPHRGEYRSPGAALQAVDLLGFTRSEVGVPGEERIRVLPAARHPEEPASRIPAAGGRPAAVRRRRPSEELFEVRRYVPGDDPRRLSWKLYAHLGELYLRVGEASPPPESRLLLVLDAARPPLLAGPRVPPGLRADCLDGLVEACAAAARAALRRGTGLLFSTQGLAAPCAGDALPLLAGVRWDPRAGMPPLPEGGRMELVLLSSPGSPCLEPLLAEARRRHWPVRLRLAGPPPEEAAPPAFRLRGLLFRGEPDWRGPGWRELERWEPGRREPVWGGAGWRELEWGEPGRWGPARSGGREAARWASRRSSTGEMPECRWKASACRAKRDASASPKGAPPAYSRSHASASRPKVRRWREAARRLRESLAVALNRYRGASWGVADVRGL